MSDANPFAMNRSEIDAFLAEIRFASISTLRRDGSPFSVVLGYEWDGESIFLSVRSTRTIVNRLARDPRICINVFNNQYPPKYVIIEGKVEIVDDPGYVRTKRKALRYMAPDSPAMQVRGLDLEEFWKGYTMVGRVCYLVRPERVLSEDGAKWGDHAHVAGAGISDAQARARGDLQSGQGR